MIHLIVLKLVHFIGLKYDKTCFIFKELKQNLKHNT